MDDNIKQASSYQLDQEILDARGINMTVEEVAGLSTFKYAERVQALRLPDDDLAFLKGLRRRIKNRLASQNSRRRSVEQLRRLARELRVVRARREAALAARRDLLRQRAAQRTACRRLRDYLVHILQERSDPTEVPSILPNRIESQENSKENPIKKVTVTETKTPLIPECFTHKIERDKNIFECRIDKLVNQSVNHIFKEDKGDKKKVFAKTVFISNSKSMVINQTDLGGDCKGTTEVESDGVLNLSVKQVRRSHGRKQTAPRRIAYAFDNDDGVLDLKIKKETQ